MNNDNFIIYSGLALFFFTIFIWILYNLNSQSTDSPTTTSIPPASSTTSAASTPPSALSSTPPTGISSSTPPTGTSSSTPPTASTSPSVSKPPNATITVSPNFTCEPSYRSLLKNSRTVFKNSSSENNINCGLVSEQYAEYIYADNDEKKCACIYEPYIYKSIEKTDYIKNYDEISTKVWSSIGAKKYLQPIITSNPVCPNNCPFKWSTNGNNYMYHVNTQENTCVCAHKIKTK